MTMPTQSEIAIVLGIVSLGGQILNAWLKAKTRAELLEMQRDLLNKVDETYQRKDMCITLRLNCPVARGEAARDVAG
jgi:hypothetical protein